MGWSRCHKPCPCAIPNTECPRPIHWPLSLDPMLPQQWSNPDYCYPEPASKIKPEQPHQIAVPTNHNLGGRVIQLASYLIDMKKLQGGFRVIAPFHSKRFSNIRQLEFITGRKISPIWVGKIHKSIWYFNHQTWMTLHYVITWNVKTYVSHPLKCRMCQNWLKWCSDTPPPPPPLNYNLTFCWT